MVTLQFLDKCVDVQADKLINLSAIIPKLFNIQYDDCYFLVNGKTVQDDDVFISNRTVHVIPRLVGGKGGFGSMLRAIGAQIEKTTNREACRDLSGRRLRDINEEKRLKNWASQKDDCEQKMRDRRRKKLERMCQEPKVDVKMDEYIKEHKQLEDDLYDSFNKGCNAKSTIGNKRKLEVTVGTMKKKRFMMDDEELDTDDSSSDEGIPCSSTNQQKDIEVKIKVCDAISTTIDGFVAVGIIKKKKFMMDDEELDSDDSSSDEGIPSISTNQQKDIEKVEV